MSRHGLHKTTDANLSKNSFLRDFFFEFFKDSENLRENNQLDREVWFRSLDLNRKEEHLFELEMYLRAIGCFFNLHNQFQHDDSQAITRDFTEELNVLSAAMDRGIALSQLLLDRGLEGTLNFQSYVENQLAPDYLRLQMLRRNLDQKSPEESLYLLNRCFRDLKKVVDQLTKRPPCTYQLFYHLGQVVIREIAFNRFFNPLLILEFRPEYDRIRSVPILDSLRTIPGQAERRASTKVFLALFRLIHYLRYVPRQGKPRILRRSLILFTLFHSESSTLAGFLRVLADRPKGHSPELVSAAAELAHAIESELRRVFGESLVNLDVKRSRLHGQQTRSVRSGRETLEDFLKDCVSLMTRVYLPDLASDRLFDEHSSQVEQAVRLRADLWLYRQVLLDFLERTPGHPDGMSGIPAHLSSFCDYFMDTSFNFLRYGDGGPFERFQSILGEGHACTERDGVWLSRFREDSEELKVYVNTTYDQVCRRTDLSDIPLQLGGLEQELQRWLTWDDCTQQN